MTEPPRVIRLQCSFSERKISSLMPLKRVHDWTLRLSHSFSPDGKLRLRQAHALAHLRPSDPTSRVFPGRTSVGNPALLIGASLRGAGWALWFPAFPILTKPRHPIRSTGVQCISSLRNSCVQNFFLPLLPLPLPPLKTHVTERQTFTRHTILVARLDPLIFNT